MGCMYHSCLNCGHGWCPKDSAISVVCPKCGSAETVSHSDER